MPASCPRPTGDPPSSVHPQADRRWGRAAIFLSIFGIVLGSLVLSGVLVGFEGPATAESSDGRSLLFFAGLVAVAAGTVAVALRPGAGTSRLGAACGFLALVAVGTNVGEMPRWLEMALTSTLPPVVQLFLMAGILGIAAQGASLILLGASGVLAARAANALAMLGAVLPASVLINRLRETITGRGYTDLPLADVLPGLPAAALVLTGIALVAAQANRGWLAILCDDGVGGAAARRHAPLVAAIPLIMGFLSAAVPGAPAVSFEFGIRVAIETGLLFALSLVNAGRIRRLDLSRTLAEAKVVATERDRSETLDAAAAGTWRIDMSAGVTDWDDHTLRIFGLAPGTSGSRALWSRLIHPEDRERAETAYSVASARGHRYDCVYRIIRPDGTIRHVSSVGGLVRRAPEDPGFFLGVNIDVTRRMEADSTLRMAKGEADRANAAKSRFLATASHDLRQPVQGLFLYVGALRDRLRGHPALPMVEIVEQALEAFRTLLDSLLDISRLDAGLVVPRPADIALGPMLCRLEAEYGAAARARKLGFRVRRERAPAVQADPALLERILRNLIENALRYTERGGVLVGCRMRGGMVRIEIVDTGIGIPAGSLDRIWDEFQQLGNPERDRSKGFGLGLSVVRRLARLTGCEVGVRSESGRGSRFWIEVPLASALPSQSVPRARRKEVVSPFATGTVLVIEDDAIVRDGLVATLSGWGHVAIASASQDEALAAVAGRTPDVIVADYRLAAGQVGTDAIVAVQSRIGRKVPAVIVTGDTDPERLREAERTGFALLHKPISAAELRAVIDRLMAGG